MQKKYKIALDTSILIDAINLNIDLMNLIKRELGKVEFIIPKQVIMELKRFGKKSKKKEKQEKLIKGIIKNNKVKVINVPGRDADNALIKLSEKAIIATNDKLVKKKVKERKGKVIYIKKKKLIEMDGEFNVLFN